MRATWLALFPTAFLIGCADHREAEVDACAAEAMRSGVTESFFAVYIRRCMSAKGYAFRLDDLCSGSYNSGIALWACFDKRPLFTFSSK